MTGERKAWYTLPAGAESFSTWAVYPDGPVGAMDPPSADPAEAKTHTVWKRSGETVKELGSVLCFKRFVTPFGLP